MGAPLGDKLVSTVWFILSASRLAEVLVTLGPVVRALAGADDGRNGEG